MNKTVYIIGAGASQEVGLPTGDRLKETISGMLNISSDDWHRGDKTIKQVLDLLVARSTVPNESIIPYVKAAWHIRDAMPQAISIDCFIDDHSGDDKIAICGKLAIVKSILEAEEGSTLKLNVNSPIVFSSLNETWYSPFFKLLRENCSKDDLKERFQSVVLIIFNYDRCVEHFMFYALQNYYRIPADEAAKLVDDMNIYHPYGSVGSLPWQTSGDGMEFGAKPHYVQLLELAKEIKTYTEGTDPASSEISEIKNHIASAHKLVFLGFAFHELNMKLIKPDKGLASPPPECYATTYRFSDSDTNAIKLQIDRLYDDPYTGPVEAEMGDLTCAKFFSEFSKSLAF